MEENCVLAATSPECREFVAERLSFKPIGSGEVVFEGGAPLHSVVFPFDGLISLQSRVDGDRWIENLTVGRDSLLGGMQLIGVTRLPYRAVTVVSGHAGWLPVPDFLEAQERFPILREAAMACVAVMVRRLMQGVACANVHSASQRISTWLLNADDRVRGTSFDLTQRMLADGFGLRPATVSDACNKLLSAGAIFYSRGKLSILDRALLQDQACVCYDAVRLEKLMQMSPLSANAKQVSDGNAA